MSVSARSRPAAQWRQRSLSHFSEEASRATAVGLSCDQTHSVISSSGLNIMRQLHTEKQLSHSHMFIFIELNKRL